MLCCRHSTAHNGKYLSCDIAKKQISLEKFISCATNQGIEAVTQRPRVRRYEKQNWLKYKQWPLIFTKANLIVIVQVSHCINRPLSGNDVIYINSLAKRKSLSSQTAIALKKFQQILLVSILSLVAISTFAQQGDQFVKIETGQGSCIIKLYNATPTHRDNFTRLVKSHYFDATTFNRILKGFVIQGGDPDSLYDRSKKLKPEQKWIKPEFDTALYHKRGAVAMGRDDNKAKESFTTQFYIVDGRTWTDTELDAIEKKYDIHFSEARRRVYRTAGGTPFLDQSYTVFGEIVKGMDLIDKLTALTVDKGGSPDKIVWMKLTLLSSGEIPKELK